jgi:hypothetical protein
VGIEVHARRERPPVPQARVSALENATVVTIAQEVVTKKAVLRHIAVGAPVLPGFDLNYWYALFSDRHLFRLPDNGWSDVSNLNTDYLRGDIAAFVGAFVCVLALRDTAEDWAHR